MTTLTPNYSLTTYAATGGDETSTFLNFRTALAGITDSNMTKIDTALHNLAVADSGFLKLDGTRSMTGNLTTTGSSIVGSGTDGQTEIQGGTNGAIELGKAGRTASGTPFIDFHSSAGSPDYDARIIANGGSGTSGQGTLAIYAAKLTQNGTDNVLSSKTGVNLFIDGGDDAITNTVDDKVSTQVPYTCLITQWTMASTDGTTGSISIVIEKTSYASFPTGWSTLGTISITTGNAKNQGTVSWSLTEGDMLRARVSGTPTSIKKLSISLKGDKR